MTDLLTALSHYDTIEAIRLINKGCSLKAKDEFERNALHISCESGLSEVSQYLITRGININSKGHDENYPIHCAVLGNDLAIIKKLIKAGQQPDLKNIHGNTALHIAVKMGYIDIVNFLIPYTDLSIKNNLGQTPFLNFSPDTSAEIILTLIESGCNINEQNDTGDTILHLCAKEKYFNMNIENIFYLACQMEADKNIINKANHNMIQSAISYENLLFLKNIELTNEERFLYFLDYLKTGKNEKCLALLWNNSLNVKVLHEDKNLLFYTENIHFVGFLLKQGININHQDIRGISRLHLSVLENNYELTKFLLDAGANPDIKDENKNSPIHFSLFQKNIALTHLLTQYNADLKSPNYLGIIPEQEIDFHAINILNEKESLTKL